MKFMKPALALLMAVFLLTACNDYGKKVTKGNIEVYYKDGATEAEATRTAEFMTRLGNASDATKSFQLVKRNDSFCIRMVVDEEKIKGMEDRNFLAIASLVADSALNGSPVNLDLTDNKFKTIRSLPYRKLTDADFK